MTMLSEKPREALGEFITRWKEIAPNVDATKARDLALAAITYYGGDQSVRERMRPIQELENKWYDSLKAGTPDYLIYDDPYILSDIWACWIVYSRKYLRGIANPKSLAGTSIVDDCGSVKSLLDLGCGFGYTTAGLKELFPDADVWGTQLKDTVQWKFAAALGKERGFSLAESIEEVPSADLVFASEYFEHIENAIEHLEAIVEKLSPKSFIIANTFQSVTLTSTLTVKSALKGRNSPRCSTFASGSSDMRRSRRNSSIRGRSTGDSVPPLRLIDHPQVPSQLLFAPEACR